MKNEAWAKEFKANFLWPHEDGSIEQLGYEFANAKTEEYRKEIWSEIVKRTKGVGQPVVGTEANEVSPDVIRSVSDFAFKIAKELHDSRSSTALFFVQQAYPDDIDGLEQMSCDDILTSVKNNAAMLLKHYG